MPFALITIGLLLIVSGARGTYPALKALLISDFTGQGNFTQWLLAIGAVGMIGYVPRLEGLSRVFLALVFVSMLLANGKAGNGGGFFTKFQAALANLGGGTTGAASS